ncbi:sugar ABC transporter substrate-binding protein [Nocardioides sp. MAHUQ-72]|uniref:sugar ABC transporter substrate-binding protein n=1 Tax=unclassified Nocardioides TaxID=2615069 RepID=UPI00360D94D1
MTSLTTPKRKAALAAVAAGSLMSLAACGGDTQPAADADTGSGSSSQAIAFSPLGLQIPAMQDLAKGVQGYGKSKGYAVTVQDPALDPQKQSTDLQSVIESGKVGGAWVIAVQPSALSALVKTAQEKKVALLLNGKPEDYGLSGMQPGITFDNIDYEAQGVAAGEELGNCINEKLDGKAQVLFEESTPGTAGKAEYEGAVKKALAETAPDAEIVATTTVTDRAKAQSDVGNALQGHPDIAAVFGQNDEGALGALGAFAAAGKDLTCVTETGGNEEVLKAVEDGKIYAVVALQFAEDMTQSFDTLTAMMDDPTADGQQLTVPQKVIKAGS